MFFRTGRSAGSSRVRWKAGRGGPKPIARARSLNTNCLRWRTSPRDSTGPRGPARPRRTPAPSSGRPAAGRLSDPLRRPLASGSLPSGPAAARRRPSRCDQRGRRMPAADHPRSLEDFGEAGGRILCRIEDSAVLPGGRFALVVIEAGARGRANVAEVVPPSRIAAGAEVEPPDESPRCERCNGGDERAEDGGGRQAGNLRHGRQLTVRGRRRSRVSGRGLPSAIPVD